MSNITFQIIPFAFIFIVILFFLAFLKNIKKRILVIDKNIITSILKQNWQENAEKKLMV